MLVGVIAVQNVINAFQQVGLAKQAHMVEFRFDYLDEWEMDALAMLRQSVDRPVIFTLRKASQGGAFKLDEPTRLERLEMLASLSPDYIDIEIDVPLNFVESLKEQFPKVKLIRSCHDLSGTPKDLDQLLRSLVHASFDGFKLVTTAKDAVDGARLMAWAKPHLAKHKNLTVFAMGAPGQFTRILSPILGAHLSYAAVTQHLMAATGGLSISEAAELYRLKKLNDASRVYALLGHPVDHSVGHLVHNGIYREQGLNAVYLKIDVEPLHLPDLMRYARELPFHGFSVTAPLKTDVVHLLKDVSPDCKPIGSVNTVTRERTDFLGFNTDGVGALDAIEKRLLVYDKSVLVLGAGGTARAIAFEAKHRGANVTCVNRTASKAKQLANGLGIAAMDMDDLKDAAGKFDILVNTVPSQLSVIGFMLPKDSLKQFRVVMDCNYAPHETGLLRQARLAGCQVVYGLEMFINQAIAQMDIWFHEKLDSSGIESTFYELLDVKQPEVVA